MNDNIFDPAVAVSSDKTPRTTLKAMELIKKELSAKVSFGVSNISFGLPSREVTTSTFFATLVMVSRLAIINPQRQS